MASCIVAVIPRDDEGVKITRLAAASLQRHPALISVGSPLPMHFTDMPYDEAYRVVELALSDASVDWRDHVELPRAAS